MENWNQIEGSLDIFGEDSFDTDMINVKQSGSSDRHEIVLNKILFNDLNLLCLNPYARSRLIRVKNYLDGSDL